MFAKVIDGTITELYNGFRKFVDSNGITQPPAAWKRWTADELAVHDLYKIAVDDKPDFDADYEYLMPINLKKGDTIGTQGWEAKDKHPSQIVKIIQDKLTALDVYCLRTQETAWVDTSNYENTLWDINDPKACIDSITFRGDGLFLDSYQQDKVKEKVGLRAYLEEYKTLNDAELNPVEE